MTADPVNDFAPKGKPSPEVARGVWDSLTEAQQTPQKLHQVLGQRGWKISLRSVQRYIKADFVPLKPPGRMSNIEKGKPTRGANVKGPLAKIARDALNAADTANGITNPKPNSLEAAVAPPIKDERTYRLFAEREARFKTLMAMDDEELSKIGVKTRKAFEIVLLEEAAQRADALSLIPREVGSLITASAEAMRASVGQGNIAPKPLEGEVLPPPKQIESPMGHLLTSFLSKEKAA